jgi:hypothetical protein
VIARFVLLLMLAIALPLAAWAGIATPQALPCPMMLHGEATMAKAPCCADKAAMGKAGSPCKLGMECQSGNAGYPVAVVTVAAIDVVSQPVVHRPTFLSTAGPADVWRPPALF